MTRTDLLDELVSYSVGFRSYGFDLTTYQNLIFNPPETFVIGATGHTPNSLFFGVPSADKYMSRDELIDYLRAGGEFLLGKVNRCFGEEVDGVLTIVTEVEYLDYWGPNLEYNSDEQVQEIRDDPKGFLNMLANIFRF